MKNIKNNKAITLIALIITIIILLILAGVAISFTIGENGIFNKSKSAVGKYKASAAEEKLAVALSEYQMEKVFLNSEEECKNTLEGILNNIEGKQDLTYNEETKTFTVVIDGEEFDVSLDGNYEYKGPSSKVVIEYNTEKTEDNNVKIKITITSPEEKISKVELLKEGTEKQDIECKENGTEYTGECIVQEDGIYKLKVTTENGVEKIVEIPVDLQAPKITHSFDKNTQKVTIKVTDEISGIKNIEAEQDKNIKFYKKTSQTEASEITETLVQEFNYDNKTNEIEIVTDRIDANYMEFLRGYKIIAVDNEENENTIEKKDLSIQNYIITTAEQLKSFADSVNNGNDYSGKTIYLGDNITLGEKQTPWTPIGETVLKTFKGNFDGKGYTISGINTDSSKKYQGLFGYLNSNTTIKNFTISDSEIKGTEYVGGVVAYVGNDIVTINVENITIKDTSITATGNYAGGILGNKYSSPTVNINNAKIESTTNIKGNSHVGGIIGYSTGSSKYETIKTSLNKGNVTGQNYVGGIVGQTAKGDIEYCYNTGTIKSTSTSGSYVGGIAGSIGYGSVITRCYNSGTIEGNDSIGGIIGHSQNSGAKVSSCYNVGMVKATKESGVGGILGRASNGAYDGLSNCLSLAGTVTVNDEIYDKAAYGNEYTGKAETVDSKKLNRSKLLEYLGKTYFKENPDAEGYPILKWE